MKSKNRKVMAIQAYHRLRPLILREKSAFHNSFVQYVLSRILVGEPSHVETVCLLLKVNPKK